MIQNSLDLGFSFCLIVLIAWFLLDARDWSFYSRLFPWCIGFTVFALALIQFGMLLQNLRAHSSDADRASTGPAAYPPSVPAEESIEEESDPSRVVAIGSWIIAFFIGIWLLGFRLGSLVLTISFLKLAANESFKTSIYLGLVNYLFFLIVFDLVLGVPLLQGAVANWLGIASIDGFLAQRLVHLWS